MKIVIEVENRRFEAEINPQHPVFSELNRTIKEGHNPTHVILGMILLAEKARTDRSPFATA